MLFFWIAAARGRMATKMLHHHATCNMQHATDNCNLSEKNNCFHSGGPTRRQDSVDARPVIHRIQEAQEGLK